MNLETKLADCLNDVLRSSGYMFEIINKNKRQSNFITGTNNQLIPPIITAQLGSSISKFDDLLDETVGKFDDAKWCIESMVENKQKQVELKKEEEERQRKLKEEEERQRKLKEEEQERQRKVKEEMDRKEAERKELEKKDAERKELERKKELQRQEELKKQQLNQQNQQKSQLQLQKSQQDNPKDKDDKKDEFDFMQFDFMNDDVNNNIPNPTDILSSIDYNLDMKDPKKEDAKNTKDNGKEENNFEDLDINNILGNNDLILDGLNMNLLDEQPSNNSIGEDFDVDNFLNQFND